MPTAEDLWEEDCTEAVPKSRRAASQTAAADLPGQLGARNGRKRQAASAPAAGRKGGTKRPRAGVGSQPNLGVGIRSTPLCIISRMAHDTQQAGTGQALSRFCVGFEVLS